MGFRTQTLRTRATRNARPKAGGERLRDRFELLVPLGSGGFGTVWEGFDMLLERPVAIKELRLDSQLTDTADALREARATARLNHPAIVSLYEVISEAATIYMISELVRGQTLAEMIERGQLSDNDAGRIGYALCEALEHAHQQGVIHRDVKPSNVMVNADWLLGSGGWRVQPSKLMDFGIASIVDPGSHGGSEQAGPHAGSRGYVSPEQAAGFAATPASDVYSLALTLFECFTGAGPGKGRRSRLARVRRDLPAELTWTLDACLESEPGMRPSVSELGEVVYEALPELSHQLAAPTFNSRLRGLFSRSPVTRSDSYAHDRPAPRVGRAQQERRAPGEGRLWRFGMAACAATLACLGMAASGAALSWIPPLVAAALIFAMPRAGWALAAIGGAAALAGSGQVGSAMLLVPCALLATLAAILPLGRLTEGALAGAGAFSLVAALQVISGRSVVIASPPAVDDPEELRRYADVALHSLGALVEPAYLASLGLWAVAGAALLALFDRSSPRWMWAVWAVALLAAQVAIGQYFELAVPTGTIALGVLVCLVLAGAAFFARERGRVSGGQAAVQAREAQGGSRRREGRPRA